MPDSAAAHRATSGHGKTRSRRFACAGVCVCVLVVSAPALAAPPSPDEIVRRAVDYWRGDSSYMKVEMIVHRPGWERTLAMIGWTRGREDTLIRFTAPARDAGNATLKLGASMWIFTPKLNQIIK
ncbi:MAG TPA: outer membrane lipoprotein-sorting protein, partial [Woeseiaceae bacterium]|nr:outer membrane lipoprotein-sorting protein [Woeseiaceae bacterium]